MIFADGFKVAPFWWEAAPPRPLGQPTPPAKASVAIIGGGYTGLCAGIELARAGTDVVVLEREPFGFGASGRNGGHVSSGVNLGKGSTSAARSPMEQSLGAERHAALMREASEAFDALERRIEGEQIECDYWRSGRFMGAATKRHYAALEQKLPGFAATGARMLPRAEQRREIGTDLYHGGMLVDRAGQLHPGRYVQGLADVAERNGVKLVHGVNVTGIEKASTGFAVATDKGPVAAEQVLIATNGYTGPLVPWVRRRVIPAASYMIATEELPADVVQRLIPNRRTIADSRRVLSYYRRSPDGKRILYGGRATLRLGDAAAVAPRLHRMMTKVFPELDGTKITHAWGGAIAFTFDFLPHLGQHRGIHFCLGCNGSGVAMQSYLGERVARQMLGRETSAFDGIDFPTVPFYAGTPWFLPMVTRWYRLRDRLDELLD
jgi:glycine/D-amino acid oxidase-like deaminating enzyme